jgi:late competence protein required for DNA uptake (superfamily II DNA/RNA helicase)
MTKVQKRCQRCGRMIYTDDWYSYIRLKYCRSCAADAKREQNAARMKELRRRTRESNALTRKLCDEQRKEIELLRMELIRQREINKMLERNNQ